MYIYNCTSRLHIHNICSFQLLLYLFTVHVLTCSCELYTHDRVWRPGPEDGRNDPLNSWKRVYLEFGFIFIQDMVERALLEEIVAAGEGRGGV